MAQQTCCVSSRPASRLVDRSLSRFSSNPRFAKRLGRLARRALAAMLIVGGTSLGTSQATVAAHDHVPATDESVKVDITANTLPSRLVGDAILGQWLNSIEAAELACGPAQEIGNPESVHSAGPLAAKHQGATGGGGALSIFPTTANQWQEYCKLQNLLAWGDQAKHWTSPLVPQVEKSPTEPTQAEDATAAVQSRSLVRGLTDLSCEEPIDIAPPTEEVADAVAVEAIVAEPEIADASEAPKFSAAALVGGGPLVTTLQDSYLAYDLSPEDAIAMRMYPIDGPAISGAPISYLGARRTSIYGPVPNFEASGNWHQQVEPGIVLSTQSADAEIAEVAVAPVAETVEEPAPQDTPALPESLVQSIGEATQWAVAAVQPDSDVRRLASASILSKRVGEAAGAGVGTADVAVGQLATRLATVMQMQPQPRPMIAPPVEKLVAQATLDAPRPIVEPDDLPNESPNESIADAQTARLMQIEIACRTALDVVKQQAARGPAQAVESERAIPNAEIVATAETIAHSFEVASIEAVADETPASERTANIVAATDAPLADELVRAQAVATACDLAAESLEKLAMSLRRAGDSLIRQAKANGAGKASLLR